MNTYLVQDGDTLETISLRVYGTTEYSSLIFSANPGIEDSSVSGTSLITPEINTPQSYSVASENPDSVSIAINGSVFNFWTTVSINEAIDSFSTVEFTAPFDVDLAGFKEAFRPFSYQSITVMIGGVLRFTGTMLTPTPVLQNNRKIVTVSCYAKAAVINDCMASSSSYPLESSGQNLTQIAKRLCSPFGVNVSSSLSVGAIFEQVSISPDEKILPYLTKLATQRNKVISNDENGDLIFQESVKTGNTIASLQQGLPPLVSVSPTTNPQSYYSHITGIEPISVGESGSKFTVINPHLKGNLRPFTFIVNDTLNSDIKLATEAKAGRMIANAVSYSVELSTWRDSNDELFKPNTLIRMIAPDAMVYSNYTFLIRGVNLLKNENSCRAILTLVLVGSFSGEIPESMPWD